MQLQVLLEDIPNARISGDPSTAVRGLAYDSRAVEPGFLFAALRGERQDGNDFVAQALERGAVAVLSSLPRGNGAPDVPWVEVEDDRLALALASRNYYGRPDGRMKMVGVTGTNGKTTVAFLLESILNEAGLKPCLFGTVVYRYGKDEIRAERTTPESLDLYRTLDRFATGGARSCAMEVSSHSLSLRRVAGIDFHAGVFTNLTQDHLDFHRTMESYLQAKSILFRALRPGAVAVHNADDPHTTALRDATRARVVTYGESPDADVRLASIRTSIEATEVSLEIGNGLPKKDRSARMEIRSTLLGRPNGRNIAAAAATGLLLDLPHDAIIRGCQAVSNVGGRFERVDSGGPVTVLIDYAHSEDAIAKLLEAVREWGPRRIVTVFGCGGDRDRGKRSRMGFAAGSRSDIVVVTSDNPRSEDPRSIIEEILPGVRQAMTGDPQGDLNPERCVTIPDRKEAIRRALSMGRDGDCIVIAGKGHETYQILGDRTIPFDDRAVARDFLRELGRVEPGRPAH